MKAPLNPFITTGYAGPAWFCDRKGETTSLLSSLENGQSVTLTSIRRIGKTGLVLHTLAHLPGGYKGIYVDIQPAEDLGGLLNILATSLLTSFPERSKPGKLFWSFIRSLRPTISFDHITGLPQVSLEAKPEHRAPQIQSVLQFLEQQPFRVVVALDEFQQMLNFPEKNTDAWLRSIIQKLRNVTFLFSGSQQHLMSDLFNSPTRPFYRSTQFLKLSRIPEKEYIDFIVRMFRKGSRFITEEVASQMLQWADGHTYYVQLICNRVYATGVQEVTEKLWKDQSQLMIREAETVFFHYRSLLTHGQWALLKAIAAEQVVFEPTSGAFLSKHGLASSAAVTGSLQALTVKELIYSDYDSTGRKFYGVYDVLFRHWARNA